jgi:uncharacterized RDD family membrane protein YckC
MYATSLSGPMPGLPDPDLDAQFYEGVPTRRFVAWLVDLVIVLLVGVPLALVFGLMTLGFGLALFPVIVGGTGFLYRTLTLASGSATWGMRFTGLEFRRHDGTRLDLLFALLHTGITAVCFGVFVLQLVSCGTILWTRYRQSIADIILGTTAINRPAE